MLALINLISISGTRFLKVGKKLNQLSLQKNEHNIINEARYYVINQM